MPQKSDEGPSAGTTKAVKPQGEIVRVEAPTADGGDGHLGSSDLMEQACERQNLRAALKRVRQNAGSPGIDGMTVEELPGYLRVHWPRLREELLAGRYQPQPVRRVAIPKPGGGERTASGPDGVRTMRYVERKPMCRKAAASWWISTWRSSSTGSTTTS